MANYHVNYLTGSNTTGDGSTASPWATISYALDTSNASTGDVIKVVGSTTTNLTTTATFASNDITQNITTGIDLTGSLSVGDTVIISPNMSDGEEFNGWMHTQVEAITSTVLTTSGYHMYPFQSTLSVTITKINDRITGNTAETINDAQLYAGALVECGYNTEFTSVIGRTYWDNTTVGVASASGIKFTINSSGSSGRWNTAMPLFRNIGFIRYSRGMEVPFTASAYANNIVQLCGTPNAGGTGFYAAPNTDSRTLFYINDCENAIMDKNYYQYNAEGDNAILNGAPMHAFVNQNRFRRLERGGGNIKDFTGWAKEGSVFGMAIPFNQSYNLNITGDIVMLGINETDITNGSQYYKASVLTSGVAQITPTSFKLVRNGRTAIQTPFNFISNIKDNAIAGNSYVKLPSGQSLKDLYLVGTNAESFFNTPMTWVDSNGTWITAGDGTIFAKENLVDQDTGNSCLELYKAPGTSYAASNSMPIIAAFPAGNAGLKLTGLTFRYKKVGGTSHYYYLRTYIGGGTAFLNGANFDSTTYTNLTVNFEPTDKGYKWVQSCAPSTIIPIFGSHNDNSATSNLLIDSITPIYS